MSKHSDTFFQLFSAGVQRQGPLWLLIFCLAPALVHADAPLREPEITALLAQGNIVLSPDVAAVMPVEQSVRQIRRIGLENDGRRIRAALRDKSVRIDARDKGGERYHDAYYNEVAAYVVARYLGLHIVPTTVLRDVFISARGLDPADKPLRASLQLWIENSRVEYDLDEDEFPGDPAHRRQQLKEIRLFDCLIGNVDRHQGNLLVDFSPRYAAGADSADPSAAYLGKIWAIDHTKAFHGSARLSGRDCQLSKIRTEPVSLQFVQGLRAWRLAELEDKLRESGLSPRQIGRLNLEKMDRRREKLLKHLDALCQDADLSDESCFSSGLWHQVW